MCTSCFFYSSSFIKANNLSVWPVNSPPPCLENTFKCFRNEKLLHVEDAGTAEVIRGKMALLQQNLDDVNRYWDEQTDGLHAAPDGKIYTRDGELYMNPDGTKPEGKKSKRKSDKLADQVYYTI